MKKHIKKIKKFHIELFGHAWDAKVSLPVFKLTFIGLALFLIFAAVIYFANSATRETMTTGSRASSSFRCTTVNLNYRNNSCDIVGTLPAGSKVERLGDTTKTCGGVKMEWIGIAGAQYFAASDFLKFCQPSSNNTEPTISSKKYTIHGYQSGLPVTCVDQQSCFCNSIGGGSCNNPYGCESCVGQEVCNANTHGQCLVPESETETITYPVYDYFEGLPRTCINAQGTAPGQEQSCSCTSVGGGECITPTNCQPCGEGKICSTDTGICTESSAQPSSETTEQTETSQCIQPGVTLYDLSCLQVETLKTGANYQLGGEKKLECGERGSIDHIGVTIDGTEYYVRSRDVYDTCGGGRNTSLEEDENIYNSKRYPPPLAVRAHKMK